MKNVLIIGSTGQIGSELTMKLRSIYNGNIVAGYIPGAEPKGELKESGPLSSPNCISLVSVPSFSDKATYLAAFPCTSKPHSYVLRMQRLPLAMPT